jgi:hypothetical protein
MCVLRLPTLDTFLCIPTAVLRSPSGNLTKPCDVLVRKSRIDIVSVSNIDLEHLSRHLFDGRGLYVELWDTTPNQAPRIIWRNLDRMPAQAGQNVKAQHPSRSSLSPPLTPSQTDAIVQRMATMQLQQPHPAAIQQPIYQAYLINQNGLQQATAGALPYAVSLPPQPMPRTSMSFPVASMAPTAHANMAYATNSPANQANLRRSTIRTEYRGVFVSNLSYDVQDQDLRKMFGVHGDIVRMEHKREPKTNSRGRTVYRSKGNAIITFATAQQAQNAKNALDGHELYDRPLHVRFDTEPTPIDPPTSLSSNEPSSSRSRRTNNEGMPLIVDGSGKGTRS